MSTRTREAIRLFLTPYRPLHVGVETCPFWPWIRDQLEGDGVVFHLVHARELRAIAQHAQKNDAVDAHLLARMLRGGLIPPAHAHATVQLETLRLVRHYARLTRYRTLCAHRIHAQLHQSGVRFAREQLLQRAGVEQLRALGTHLPLAQRRLIRTHLMLIKHLTELPRCANRWVRGAFVAATMSRVRFAPDTRLAQYYERMKARVGWKKARVATARKLARAVYGAALATTVARLKILLVRFDDTHAGSHCVESD